VRRVAEAALIACSSDYALLRPVLIELKRRYPEGGQSEFREGLGGVRILATRIEPAIGVTALLRAWA
jgi:hypothetical protein